MPWDKVTLLGVGLLGGSLGLALRRHQLARSVVGYVRRPITATDAEAVGAVDQATLNLQEAVENADLVVLCTPLSAMRGLLEESLPFLAAGATVTDVGSAKGCVVRELEDLLSAHSASFVGSHPMAGSEKVGVRHAKATLFKKRTCVVTETTVTDLAAREKVCQLWRSVEAQVVTMSPEDHDHLVAHASHLPHVAACALVTKVLSPKSSDQVGQLCASGFRDATRIAKGDVTMWRDILSQNAREVVAAIKGYRDELAALESLLAAENWDQAAEWLRQAQALRGEWEDRHGEVPSNEDGRQQG